jgi:hypothetical protein
MEKPANTFTNRFDLKGQDPGAVTIILFMVSVCWANAGCSRRRDGRMAAARRESMRDFSGAATPEHFRRCGWMSQVRREELRIRFSTVRHELSCPY